MIFLADENIPLKSIKILRKRGYDVSAVIEEMPGMSDEKILHKASAENRIILTFDRDYGELIYKRKIPFKPGILFFRFIPRHPGETAEILLNLLNIENIGLSGRFTIVERDKVRQRSL